MKARLRALPAGWKVALVFVALVAALNLMAAIGNRIAPQPSGPAYSSYSTTSDGTAALAELLEGDGHEVERLRGSVADATLEPDATVFVLGAGRLTTDESGALRDFLDRGGQLVAGGPDPHWLSGVAQAVPEWSRAGSETLRPFTPAPEVASVATVRSGGAGTWDAGGAALPLLGSDSGPTVVSDRVGAGHALLMADVSPLQNRLLDEDDNAALALGLAGDHRGKVIFVEGVHGFGESRGLAALPDDWKWALAGLGLAGLIGVWAIGRRLGPAEAERRPLPPPRRRFVDAQALTLARTGEPSEAASPVRRAARERLARRAALGPEAGEPQLRSAAEGLGLEPDETEAVLGHNHDVLAAGRALSKLSGGRS